MHLSPAIYTPPHSYVPPEPQIDVSDQAPTEAADDKSLVTPSDTAHETPVDAAIDPAPAACPEASIDPKYHPDFLKSFDYLQKFVEASHETHWIGANSIKKKGLLGKIIWKALGHFTLFRESLFGVNPRKIKANLTGMVKALRLGDCSDGKHQVAFAIYEKALSHFNKLFPDHEITSLACNFLSERLRAPKYVGPEGSVETESSEHAASVGLYDELHAIQYAHKASITHGLASLLRELSTDPEAKYFSISAKGKITFYPEQVPEAHLHVEFLLNDSNKRELSVKQCTSENLSDEEKFILQTLTKRNKMYCKMYKAGFTAKTLKHAYRWLLEKELDCLNQVNPKVIPDTAMDLDQFTQMVHRITLNGKKYIAAPLFTEEAAESFWKIIAHEKCPVIVKLTDEQPSIMDKLYWPNEENMVYTFGDDEEAISVKCQKMEWLKKQEIIQRTFNVTYKNETHQVIQLDFIEWPDGGVPDTMTFSQLLLHTEHLRANSPHPVLVHCMGGQGRTGTFIAAQSHLEDLKQSKRPYYYDTILEMRRHRPLQMVETGEQFVFLNELV